MTESMYWNMIRMALRSIWIQGKWIPRKQALDAAKRNYKGSNKKRKYEYQCAISKKWFALKDVEVDHIEQVGSLKSYDDLVPFVKRLFVEDHTKLRVVSKEEHRKITNKQNKERKKKE